MFGQIAVLFVISVTSLNVVLANPPSKCGLYGLPPCLYVPAPPGQTPSCATPGKTYCENIPQYPKRIVHNLLSRYGLDIAKLLVDEIAADFSANHFHTSLASFAHPASFGPQFGGHYNPSTYFTPSQHHHHHQPEQLQSFVPPANGEANGYAYPNPNTLPAGHPGYDYRAPKTSASYSASANRYRSAPYQQQSPSKFVYEVQRVSEYNPAEAFRRYTRDLSGKYTKDKVQYASDNEGTSSVAELHEPIADDAPTNQTRSKRQAFGRDSLCEVNTQFIMPQAALNNQGNWMYVINQQNVPAARQLVKSETCASSVCSKLCQLPIGYGSRCEQKFIQKRLIALNADGQNFYTDTFWFPSCCVCTISNNL